MNILQIKIEVIKMMSDDIIKRMFLKKYKKATVVEGYLALLVALERMRKALEKDGIDDETIKIMESSLKEVFRKDKIVS